MSNPHDSHAHDPHAHDPHAHDPHAHDAHAHDEPEDGLGPDEAPTPAWLTAVGAAVFFLAAVWWLAAGNTPTAPSATPEPAESAAPAH